MPQKLKEETHHSTPSARDYSWYSEDLGRVAETIEYLLISEHEP